MANADGRSSGWRIAFTLLFALIVAILPLPKALAVAKPHLLLLLMIYWSLSSPQRAGLALAWLCGIAIDMLKGTLIGQHGAAFLLIAFFTHKFQLRLRIFPIYHQTLIVFMLMAMYDGLVYMIDGFIGQAVSSAERWYPVLSSTVLWPLLVAIMDTWNRRRSR